MTTKVPPITVRGIHGSIPSGYIVGRTDPGTGKPQLIPMKTLGHALTQAGAVSGFGGIGTPGNPAYEFLGAKMDGPFAAVQTFELSMCPHKVLFPSASGSSRSRAECKGAPTSNAHFVLTNNLGDYLAHGTSVICTVAFAAGATTGTFTWGSPVTLNIGDITFIVFQNSVDPSWSDVQVLFCGDPKK